MRKKKSDGDQGRRFYETSSPFETQVGDPASKPKTYTGQVDQTVLTSKTLGKDIPGTRVLSELQAEQYDNPRGYPGIALITSGNQTAKFPRHEHSIQHTTDNEGKLARTGK